MLTTAKRDLANLGRTVSVQVLGMVELSKIDWVFGILVMIVFANRYVFGSLLRMMDRRTRASHDRDPDVWPTVTIIVPVFNEGADVLRTAKSFTNQDYPSDKLNVVFVDDCSTDGTSEYLHIIARQFDWMRVDSNPHNMGKRLGIKRAVLGCTSDLILSVDSDVIVESNALTNLVRHMHSTGADAVGGCVFVSNADETWLTRMQAVKYWVGYQFLKNLENAFDHIMCLSGCLTLYKREALLRVDEDLEKRQFLGADVKYGEDRYLTRKLVERGYRTRLCFTARCFTKAPPRMPGYISQQLRWRRSNSVDLITALGHLHRLKPVVLVHYLSMGMLLFFYPLFLTSQMIRLGVLLPMVEHAMVVSVFALAYELNKRTLPAFAQTSGLWFLAIIVVFPVMYMFMTPLALATLGAASWETRGHSAVVKAAAQRAADAPEGVAP